MLVGRFEPCDCMEVCGFERWRNVRLKVVGKMETSKTQNKTYAPQSWSLRGMTGNHLEAGKGAILVS
jgi:hypothetical protein